MEPFIGQIMMFGGNFAPRGWAKCDGSLLAISSHSALFSILGTTFGGDGRTTFGLPDLRGRVPMHPGTGPGLTPRTIGTKSGSETNTLTVNQLPSHHHTLHCTQGNANSSSPVGKVMAATQAKDKVNTYGDRSSGEAADAMAAESVANTGGGQSVNNVQPFQCVNFCIALEGLYPSRA